MVSKHLRNVFADGELDEESNVQNLHIAGSDKPARFYKSAVEQTALVWLENLGWAVRHGLAIAPGDPEAERSDPNYRDVVLEGVFEDQGWGWCRWARWAIDYRAVVPRLFINFFEARRWPCG